METIGDGPASESLAQDMWALLRSEHGRYLAERADAVRFVAELSAMRRSVLTAIADVSALETQVSPKTAAQLRYIMRDLRAACANAEGVENRRAAREPHE